MGLRCKVSGNKVTRRNVKHNYYRQTSAPYISAQKTLVHFFWSIFQPSPLKPQYLITTVQSTIYWQPRPKGLPAAIVTWYPCALRKRHITFEQRLGNGNVSLLRAMHSCLIVNRFSLQLLKNYATSAALLYNLFAKSHGHHTQSHALPQKHKRMCWNYKVTVT